MEKISINLLPAEFAAEEKKLEKFYRVQSIGIFITLVMVFLSIVTITLRILQSNRIKDIQVDAAKAESRITSYQGRQVQLMLLKNRLDIINQHLGKNSKQAEIYILLDSLLPPGINITAISVGRQASISVSALILDTNTLDRLLTDLLDKEKNEGKISKVSVETINRGRDRTYRVNFLVEAKK